MKQRPFLGYGLVFLAAVLWGTLGIVTRMLGGSGISSGAMVTLRAGGAALVLFPLLALVRPALLRIRLKDLPFFAAYGLVSVAAFYLLYFHTIRLIPVATASVLLYTAPAFVAVVAHFLLGEALTRHKALVLLVTLAGCALVARAYEPAVFRGHALGLITGLGSGLTYGMYGIFGKFGLRRYSPWTLQAYSLLFGTLPLLLLYGGEAVQAVADSPHLLPHMAYLSLVTTLAAYGLYLAGLQFTQASHASIIATVEPVVAALLGFLLLSEPLALPQIAGVVLVLGSAVALNVQPKANATEKTRSL